MRQAPAALIAGCVDAVMTGIGVGMAAVFLVLLVARALVAVSR